MSMSAGSVSLGVKPDTTGFGSTLKSNIMGHTAGVGESMGSMIMGGLKTFAGPIAAVTAAFSIKHVLEDSMKSFEDLAGSVKGIQRVMGGTTEEISGLRGAMQLAGVNVDGAGSALTIFSKKLGLAASDGKKTAAMSQLLGTSFKDAHGQMLPMAQLLPEVADKFEKMPNGAEKTALAMQLFGKQGAQLLPFLNKGSEGIAELTGKAKTMGLVLDDTSMNSFAESKKSARDFNAAIQGLKVTLGGDLLPVVDAVQNVFRNALAPAITAVTGFLGEHRESFLKLGEGISAFGKGANAALGPVMKSIGDSFKSLGPIFAELGPQLMQLASAFSPVHIIFEALKPVLPAIIDAVVGLAVSIGGTLASVLKEILPPISNVVNLLVGTLGGIFQQLMPAITGLAKSFGEYLGVVIQQLAPVVVTLVKAVASLIPPLMPLITQIISLAITAIVPLAQAIMPLITAILPIVVSLLNAIIPIAAGLATGLVKVLVPAIQFAITVFGEIITVVTNVIKWFAELITNIANGIQKIPAFFQKVGDFFGQLPDAIMKGLGDAARILFDAGKNIIQGLIDGAGTMGAAVGRWINNLGTSIMNGFKSLLGIHSPSTVFNDYGVNIGEGLANGIESQIDPVTNVVESMGEAISTTMDGVLVGVTGKLVDVAAMTKQFNQGVSNMMDTGLSTSEAVKYVNSVTPGGSLQASLDTQLGQATFYNKVTGMSTTMGGDLSTIGASKSVAQLLAAGYTQTSGAAVTGSTSNAPGSNGTINYYAAPNQSLDSQAALNTAIQRARAMNQW